MGKIIWGLKTNTIIEELEENFPVFLYPTGSRVFSPESVTPSTDYDFFCRDTHEVRNWLILHQFRQLDRNNWRNYTDLNTAVVYRYEGEVQVDIQLQQDVDRKIRAQAYILSLWWAIDEKMKTKENVHHIWNSIYRLL